MRPYVELRLRTLGVNGLKEHAIHMSLLEFKARVARVHALSSLTATYALQELRGAVRALRLAEDAQREAATVLESADEAAAEQHS